jgi:hypothetical protein
MSREGKLAAAKNRNWERAVSIYRAVKVHPGWRMHKRNELPPLADPRDQTGEAVYNSLPTHFPLNVTFQEQVWKKHMTQAIAH